MLVLPPQYAYTPKITTFERYLCQRNNISEESTCVADETGLWTEIVSAEQVTPRATTSADTGGRLSIKNMSPGGNAHDRKMPPLRYRSASIAWCSTVGASIARTCPKILLLVKPYTQPLWAVRGRIVPG